MKGKTDYKYEITICFTDNEVYECVADIIDGLEEVINIQRDNTIMVIPKKAIKYIIYKYHYKGHNL